MGVILSIAAGGAIGAVLRYGVLAMAPLMFGTAFPYNTILVNIIGSFLMGIFVTYFTVSDSLSPELKSFLTIGLMGGFTTFSAFSLDILKMWESDQMMYAILYALVSVIFSVGAIFVGVLVAKNLIG